MKIACVDKTASERLDLQVAMERVLEQNREFLGYARLADFVSVSREELLLSSLFDAIVVGPCFSLDESLFLIRQLKESVSTPPIIVFIAESVFTVGNIQRFERLDSQVFSENDCGPRLAAYFLNLVAKQVTSELGKLIVVDGAKGGVGVTSLVSGLAHAAQAQESTSVVVDLSPAGALLRYCNVDRWQSADYMSLLVSNSRVSLEMVDKLIVTAPNGIDFLLPPAGGAEVRELWLREHHSFEVTLEIITHLCERYDVVIVDLARTEGILPFALLSRADVRLLITSNEAASVHLLGLRLAEFADVPGRSEIIAVVNEFNEGGLSLDDIVSYLKSKAKRLDISWLDYAIPHDGRARFWMGTSNSFYTEARPQTRRHLEKALRRFRDKTIEVNQADTAEESKFKRLVRSFNRTGRLRLNTSQHSNRTSDFEGDEKLIPSPEVSMLPAVFKNDYVDFEPPRFIGNCSGSFTLENLLLLMAAVSIASVVLPELMSVLQIYLRGFTE